jgi:hypothetical protein
MVGHSKVHNLICFVFLWLLKKRYMGSMLNFNVHFRNLVIAKWVLVWFIIDNIIIVFIYLGMVLFCYKHSIIDDH